jgi:Sulfotransferase family
MVRPVPGRDPFVYVVGCPRSGTTVVQRMLDAHPDVAVSRSTHWVTLPLRDAAWSLADGRVTPELAEQVVGFRRFPKMDVDPDAVRRLAATAPPPTYEDFVRGVYALFAGGRQKGLAGDKTPAYVRWIPALADWFPTARFVHVVRDGRDVCLSLLDPKNEKKRAQLAAFSTWVDDPVATAALRWEWDVRLGREGGAAVGADRYLELRYEALVGDPDAACRSLCTFLGLEAREEMVRFHEGRSRPGEGRDAKHAWGPVTAGLREWRRDMAAGDRARIEAVAGPLLDELGYPSPEAVGPEDLTRAAALRAVFAHEARGQGERTPDGWPTGEPVAGAGP